MVETAIIRRKQLPHGPVDWVIPNLLERGKVSVLFGQPGSFKSALGIALSWMVIYGENWCHEPLDPGEAVYVAAEGLNGFGERMDGWVVLHKHKDDEREDKFIIINADKFSGKFDPLDPDHIESLIQNIREQSPKPALIIFDTLNTLLRGRSENMFNLRMLSDNLEHVAVALRAAVLVLHHSAAHGKRERGSSVLRGSTNAMLKSVKIKSGVAIETEKQRNGRTDIVYRFESHRYIALPKKGKQSETIVLLHRGSMSVDESEAEKQYLVRQQIAEIIEPNEVITVKSLCQRMKWGIGGKQNEKIRSVIPPGRWWEAETSSGIKNLRLTIQGQGKPSTVECRIT